MRVLLSILMLVILGCNHQKGGLDEFLGRNADKTGMTTVCSCGKTMDALLNAKSTDLSTPRKIMDKFGHWDTTYSENAVIACTSFVYKCGNRFVSFHFKPISLDFAGRSYGDIIDGKFSNSGNLIELK